MDENNTVNQQQVKKHKKKIQIISFVCIIVVILVATIASIPLVKTLNSPEGLEALKEKLESYSGFTGILIFTFIQALQVVIAVIPPIQIVGGVLFGWLWGGILSYLGTFLGTLAIFALVKKFGRPIVEAFVDDKVMKKFKFLHDAKRLTLILIILYLIPGVPKDVISYIVPLTPISKKNFFKYVMPCRLPAIMLSTILGSSAVKGSYKIAFAVIGVAVVLCILGYFFKDLIIDKMRHHKKEK